MKSLAIVFPRPNEVTLDEVDVPDDLGPTDVSVRTLHSALSPGTERWLLTGRFYRTASAHGVDRSFPLVPGYQKVGIVERIGTEVRAFRPGDRVFCTVGRVAGGTARGAGGHLRYSVQDQSEVISVPRALSASATAGLVLAQVGRNGASRPPLERGDVAVVLGDGLVGQYAAQSLRARGARVLLSGRRPMRLDLARRYSADAIHDARESGLEEAIEGFRRLNPRSDRNREVEPSDWVRSEEAVLRDARAAHDARGADVIVDTTGSREMVRAAASLLRHNGHLVLLGWYPEPENELLEDWLHQREIAMYGTGGWRRHRLLAALDAILTGHLKPAELVTHQVPVAEAPRVYRELLIEKREDSLGVIFDWGP